MANAGSEGSDSELFAYFGYGSLVNRRTLNPDIVGAFPATLKGWRRHWQSRDCDGETGIALLSIHQAPDCEIDGLVIVDRMKNLPALDVREARYDRVGLTLDDFASLDSPAFGAADLESAKDFPLHVYVGRSGPREANPPKLLQSYLDVVLSGFLQEFGEAGLARFLTSTIGFEREIIADRHQPVYARYHEPELEWQERFDRLLRGSGVVYPLSVDV